MKESKLSQVKKSLPLKLGASLIGGATLLVCVGALALPARAAEGCGGENKISECVPTHALAQAIAVGAKAKDNNLTGDPTQDTVEKVQAVHDINVTLDPAAGVEDLAGLGTFSNIQSLNLSGNPVSDVSELSGLKHLRTLDLSKTHLINGLSQIGQKDELETLNLNSDGEHRLRDISALSSFQSLTTLKLQDQKVADVSPLSSLTKLKTLDLNKNEIVNVAPLASLTKLNYLDVGNNHIKDIIPITGLTGLEGNLRATGQTITVTPRHEYNKDQDWVVDGVKLNAVGEVYAQISNQKADGEASGHPTANNSKAVWDAPAKYRAVSYDFAGAVSTNGNKVLGLFAGHVQQFASAVTRLSGNVRYDTMGAIVQEAYPGRADTVIVASGENYPDALAASGLSGLLNAPVVLTDTYQLSARADGQLSRLRPSRVIVVGGTSAVSDDVFDQISKRVMAPTEADVVRIAGTTRRDTANEIFAQAKKQHAKGQPDQTWNADTAIVATGENFVDALSISSLAKQKSYPVFLSGQDGLDASTVKAIRDHGFANVIIAGGAQAVPRSVVSQLKTAGVDGSNIHRIGGATRYQTSLQIAQYQSEFYKAKLNRPVFATGENFPDALVGGVLAGRKATPVVLVSPDTAVNKEALNWIKSTGKFNPDTDFAYVLGGIDAVSEEVSEEISSILSD